MSGRAAEPNRAVAFAGNLLFVAFLFYALNPALREWANYRTLRAGQWLAWGAERAWRGARRWWRVTSPWYQELREQERPL